MSHRKALGACLVMMAALALGAARPAFAQKDSSKRAVDPADTVRPPITPRRAFLYSLMAPGWAQTILGRNKVGAGLIAVEAVSIGMIRESGWDVDQARRQLGDSLVVSWVDDNGARIATAALARRRFQDNEVNSRRNHVEDWIALLIANHLFAAADAFVAASLWDVPAHIEIGGTPRNLRLAARITW